MPIKGAKGSPTIADGNTFIAKGAGSADFENVHIIEVAVDIQSYLTKSKLFELLRVYSKRPRRFLSWTYEHLPASCWVTVVWEIEGVWHLLPHRVPLPVQPSDGPMSGCLATILYDYRQLCLFMVQSMTNEAEVGSQLSYGRRFHFIDGLFQPVGLYSEYDSLADANNNKKSSEHDEPPVGRRFIIALFGNLAGIWIGMFGWKFFDSRRRLLGSVFIGGGGLLSLISLGLFWLTNFPSTWNWLI
jgi:hypothetical protein